MASLRTPTGRLSIQSRYARFQHSEQPIRIALGDHEAIWIATGKIPLRYGGHAPSNRKLGLNLDLAKRLDA